jgi:Thrombospondin type 3 repeat
MREWKRIGTKNGSRILAARPSRRGARLYGLLALWAFILTTGTPTAHALNVGYYEMCSAAGESSQIAPITTAGHTPVLLNDLAAADLSGVDIIFVTNCSNSSYGTEYTSRLSDIASAVGVGKILVLHDRYVEPAETILPGGATFTITRDFADDANIDVLDGSTILTNGPGGVIDNTTLDGGCSSSHGFAVAGTLPGSADLLLSRSNPGEIVTFAYAYGSGHVIYSSIPLDYYLAGGSCQPNLAPIYAPNVIAYAASLFCTDPTDTDGDGIGDSCDNCPSVSNPNQRDCDLDGEGDACDGDTPDTDGDQVADACDNCPSDANPGQEDSDSDGIGNACDPCVGPGADGDGDGICDAVDNCPIDPNAGQEDSDFDGIGDACDPCVDDPSYYDFDGDGFCSNSGLCPSGCDNCYFTYNPDQADGDGDGIGDACDNCPADANPSQQDSDFDGFGDACDTCIGYGAADSDADSLCDPIDNCPNDPNPFQEDADSDGIGDACDPCVGDPSYFDFDGDGFCSDATSCPSGCDNCPFTFNSVQTDADGDGLGDACDNCPLDANPGQEDADFDGAGDVCDPCVGAGTTDTDGDGLCDGADPCPTDPTQACATLFGCTGTGAAASILYRINPSTGVGFPVGPMGIFGCSGLAFDPTTDILYAAGFDATFFTNSLFTVDPSTGAATLVGPTGQSRTNDIAFRSDGELFAFDRFAVAAGTVSTTTGHVTLLGVSGLFEEGNGITFDQSDELLHAGNAQLSTIDQTTGAATFVSPLSLPPVGCGFPRINSMDTHASGVVYGVMNCSFGQSSLNYLVTIGVPSGSVNAVGPSVPGLDGIAFAPQGVCGDGMPDFGEECDDGNTVDGDCCSSTCEFEPAGDPCPGDASLCTIDRCDGAGTCVSAPPTGCKAPPGKSILILKKKPQKDKLVFKWLKGPLTDVSEYGDPQSSADYALCLYTGVALHPLTELTVPADSMKWKPVSTKGFKYKDSGGSADGVTNILLKSGAAGKSKALVKAKGTNLSLPPFGNLPLPVTAQLVNSETNACFQATYVLQDVKKNDLGQFKAKAQ